MTRPSLRVVKPAPAPSSTYAEVSSKTRMDFDELQARVRRVGTWLHGSFAAEAKRESVMRELNEIEVLARVIRTGIEQ